MFARNVVEYETRRANPQGSTRTRYQPVTQDLIELVTALKCKVVLYLFWAKDEDWNDWIPPELSLSDLQTSRA